jgi:hypothetical protein
MARDMLIRSHEHACMHISLQIECEDELLNFHMNLCGRVYFTYSSATETDDEVHVHTYTETWSDQDAHDCKSTEVIHVCVRVYVCVYVCIQFCVFYMCVHSQM